MKLRLSLTGTPVHIFIDRGRIGEAHYFQGAKWLFILSPLDVQIQPVIPGQCAVASIAIGRRGGNGSHWYACANLTQGEEVILFFRPEEAAEFAGAQAFLDSWFTWALVGSFEPGGFLTLSGGFDDPRDTQDRPE